MLLFLSTFKKGQKMAKWPNYFISGKQFKKGQMATLFSKEDAQTEEGGREFGTAMTRALQLTNI